MDYGRDRSYGHTVEAEIRELLTHVPVWDGQPGALQRVPHAERRPVLRARAPGPPAPWHRSTTTGSGTRPASEIGADRATPRSCTAPRRVAEPFTFTAFGDEGIPGPSLDRDPSLLPESDWGMWNNGSLRRRRPGQAVPHAPGTPPSAVITQITRVRNLTNGTPARFNLLAGDLCYAQAEGDIQPIINPDGPHGKPAVARTTRRSPRPNSGGWDYYDPWIWTSWFPMIEPSAASIPWMVATGNHDTELFSSAVAADHVDRGATTSRSATAGWPSGWTCPRPARPPARRCTASATATSGSSAWTPTS